MNIKLLLIVSLSVVVGLLIGVSLPFRDCPSVVIGSETTTVFITVSDTISVPVLYESIQVVHRDKYDTIKIRDTIIINERAATCYEFSEVMADSAHIGVSICSDSLPGFKPLDLTATIDYLPPPRYTTEIFRVDTIQINDRRRFIVGICIAGLAGYAIGKGF